MMRNVVVARVECKAIVRNIPEDVALGKRKGFMVVKVDNAILWYYGLYESDAKAVEVAESFENGLVLEV